MRFILGLTGQTGAGKSLAATVAQKNGFYVIDCDKIAHMVLTTKKAKTALVKEFGANILTDGEINRQKLALAAFESNEKTELLNKTVLPFIVEEINNILKGVSKEYILLDAPTLFESGADNLCDKTVGIIADKDIRFKRIIQRDNLTELAAIQRINAGKDNDFYIQKCDYVIENNATNTEFINNFENMLKDIFKGRQ